MTPARIIVCVLLALTSSGGLAHAETSGGAMVLAANDFAASPYYSSVTVPASQLEWDSRKARWGLKLGVEQHTDRDVQWKDVAPGVFWKVTPRLHIGGSVNLAPDQIETQHFGATPQMPAPRVRLETTFRF
jgi:hypothetical protein